jgi:wyosine [tRNA(Phe)-imidazoG37] synthetase (radical SAM superfamily)
MADATPLWGTIVYGPIRSRRLGTSLGVNLTPLRSKLCSFDCGYCQCGSNTPKAEGARWPSPDEVAHALTRALARTPAPPEWITLSGNGEPTLHPRLTGVVDRILAVRAAVAVDTRVAVLSNGLTAGQPTVRTALLRVDARMMKLDPGPMERVNGVSYDANQLVTDYRALKPLTIQAMVARGPDWDGSSEASLAAWLPLVTRAGPNVVHLYSVARPPADATVQNVPRERLERMAVTIRSALPRCRVEVF